MRRVTRNICNCWWKFNGNGYLRSMKVSAIVPNIKGGFSLSNVSVQLGMVGVEQYQLRNYTPVRNGQSKETRTNCWNCNKTRKRENCVICPGCGHIQDADMEIDYFKLLDLPKEFEVKTQELTRRFRELQTLVHPDKFSNKSRREQTNSADWSSLINKAYKTLSVPIDRGQYLLKLQGEQLPKDNSALNKEFLLEMMERNEEVEEANDCEALQKLYVCLTQELGEKTEQLNNQFKMNHLENVKSILVKMKYLLSIQQTIKKKMHNLLDA